CWFEYLTLDRCSNVEFILFSNFTVPKVIYFLLFDANFKSKIVMIGMRLRSAIRKLRSFEAK
ncbi:hypothetical protein KK466_29805, partial [Klebsiella pneumoniae]|uniref:hypothetical protein n=1 Tax=Klebsiella pneumoniae TaxID=573 RepID=UPI001BE0F375